MITSHELARELLNRPNGFITANHGDKEFYIDAYKRVITDNENNVLASITDENIIEEDSCKVVMIRKKRN